MIQLLTRSVPKSYFAKSTVSFPLGVEKLSSANYETRLRCGNPESVQCTTVLHLGEGILETSAREFVEEISPVCIFFFFFFLAFILFFFFVFGFYSRQSHSTLDSWSNWTPAISRQNFCLFRLPQVMDKTCNWTRRATWANCTTPAKSETSQSTWKPCPNKTTMSMSLLQRMCPISEFSSFSC